MIIKITKYFQGGHNTFYARMPANKKIRCNCWDSQLHEWGDKTVDGCIHGYRLYVNKAGRIPRDAQWLKFNNKYLQSIHNGAGKAKVNHLGSIQEPPPVVGVDGVASNLPAPVASGMKPNNVARISKQKVTDHIPAPFTLKSSLSPQKSGLLPQPSEQAVVPPTTRPELFCGLTPDAATVATLTAILIGLLKETTNADKIYFALRYARKTAMQSGIAQSDFDRVKDIICKKWKTIAAGSWMHKAFGTGDLKGI
jgi:hypothetical protein